MVDMSASFPRRPGQSGFPMRDLALEAYFARWQSVARYQLAASDSETLSLVELVATADEKDRRRWETLRLGYTDPRGANSLRTTIAEGYETATAESIRCCTGGQEGIFTVTQALLGADDHAIVVTPNYQSAESVGADRSRGKWRLAGASRAGEPAPKPGR